MTLLRKGKRVEDAWTRVAGDDAVPDSGPVYVELERFKRDRDALLARGESLGVLLKSGEAPEDLADDLDELELVALEFPVFNDGRSYSAARVLRERYGFAGELRAVGDVLLEQLHFMHRAGIDAFDMEADHPEEEWQIAEADMQVWYQPTADGRSTALQRRRG